MRWWVVVAAACCMGWACVGEEFGVATTGKGGALRALEETGRLEDDYLVVDLSGGPSASSYPVSRLSAVPSGGWTDDFKTTKLVLRRIPAGTFGMGSPGDELGRAGDETQHEVTLTQEFHIGIFPVTQRQWERVMGTWPSWFNNPAYRDNRPVERVSYHEIREDPLPMSSHRQTGSPIVPNWPQSVQAHSNSFMGRLRERTGLPFDLPTEAQWEVACRAGTATALNSGKNLTGIDECPNVAEVGRYRHNSGSAVTQRGDASVGTAEVGNYSPNAWGLYDMHGNVWEWCLDWYGAYPGTVTDPRGATTGSRRVIRGGGWSTGAHGCRSAFRSDYWPGRLGSYVGFRAAVPPGH